MPCISFHSDLSAAVAKADLVIEAIPEVVQIKTDFYTELGKVAPEKTIFIHKLFYIITKPICRSDRPSKKFLALHFANEISKNNTA